MLPKDRDKRFETQFGATPRKSPKATTYSPFLGNMPTNPEAGGPPGGQSSESQILLYPPGTKPAPIPPPTPVPRLLARQRHRAWGSSTSARALGVNEAPSGLGAGGWLWWGRAGLEGTTGASLATMASPPNGGDAMIGRETRVLPAALPGAGCEQGRDRAAGWCEPADGVPLDCIGTAGPGAG